MRFVSDNFVVWLPARRILGLMVVAICLMLTSSISRVLLSPDWSAKWLGNTKADTDGNANEYET